MSRCFFPKIVLCVFILNVPNVEALLKCNITLRYAYYDYRLNATCESRCSFPSLATLSFRDREHRTPDLGDSRTYVARPSLTATGSFWGEYLDCRLPDHTLICVALIVVNRTIEVECVGKNGIWPPFTGPFVTDDSLPTTPDDITDEYRSEPENHQNFHGDTRRRTRQNVSSRIAPLGAEEPVSHETHAIEIACTAIVLTLVCVLFYYLRMNGPFSSARERRREVRLRSL